MKNIVEFMVDSYRGNQDLIEISTSNEWMQGYIHANTGIVPTYEEIDRSSRLLILEGNR